MGLEDIKEVKECVTPDEVNKLLSQGTWRLLETKIDKVKVADGKIPVGMDGHEDFWGGQTARRYEIQYKELLTALYIVGRYQ